MNQKYVLKYCLYEVDGIRTQLYFFVEKSKAEEQAHTFCRGGKGRYAVVGEMLFRVEGDEPEIATRKVPL
jgi:hypothetical protein